MTDLPTTGGAWVRAKDGRLILEAPPTALAPISLPETLATASIDPAPHAPKDILKGGVKAPVKEA